MRQGSGRGVGYWTDGDDDARIYVVTIGYQLVALDARTGYPIPSFGNDGIVDLKQHNDQDLDSTAELAWRGAPVVAKDIVLVGASSRPGHVPPSRRNAKGYVRGFDARTGERRWIFNTIPQSGEFGYESSSTTMALEVGSRIAHYDVTALIGEGGWDRSIKPRIPS